MKPGTVHRSLGIYLKAQENPGKPHLGERMMVLRPVIASNEVPYSNSTKLQLLEILYFQKKKNKISLHLQANVFTYTIL